MTGDNINIFGRSYHKKPVGNYSGTTNNIIVTELINTFALSAIVSSKGVTGSAITLALDFVSPRTGT
ncbi:MAG TPA: hypothetical protein PK504_09970 [Ferruginibacter sp.]|nr:hypothetical protein [Ferruginibacter sp.]HRE62837.1 hypothetical protein [Ferruginibacter sp.]